MYFYSENFCGLIHQEKSDFREPIWNAVELLNWFPPYKTSFNSGSFVLDQDNFTEDNVKALVSFCFATLNIDSIVLYSSVVCCVYHNLQRRRRYLKSWRKLKTIRKKQ